MPRRVRWQMGSGMEAVFHTGPYDGWERCAWLATPLLECVVTLETEPRIIRFGPRGGANIFKAFSGDMGRSGGEKWRLYGGHRLWLAPEDAVLTYEPDNGPLAHEWDGTRLTLMQAAGTLTGIEKRMSVALDGAAAKATVTHEIVNRGVAEAAWAPWAITAMAPGGWAVFPQEPDAPHPGALLPARPLVLWPYTNMADKRFTWERRFVAVRQDPGDKSPQKLGVFNSLGWAAYCLDGLVFRKAIRINRDGDLPDFGCNFEFFVNGDMLELETLGPAARLAPGESVSHTEEWLLMDANEFAAAEPVFGEARMHAHMKGR